MSLKERMLDYIKRNAPCPLKRMRLDLAVDGRTAQRPTIELIDEGLIDVIYSDGAFLVVPVAQTQSSSGKVKKND